MEEWKEIEGFKNYFVSNEGRVFSEKSKKYLSPDKVGSGYLKVDLYLNGERNTKLIHRLVAEAFVPNNNPKINTEVNHKDENKTNNKVENLEWCDRKYNNEYSKIQEILTKQKKKPVYQYSLDNKLVTTWPSARECERNSEFKQSAISRCCKGLQTQHKGYKWLYKPL